MKRWLVKLVLRLLLALVMALIAGVVIAIYNVDEFYITPVSLLITFIIFLPAFKNGWFKGIHLINQGKIDDAIILFNDLHNIYKWFPLYKYQGLYNLACCYHLFGEFDKSMELLEEGWDKFDKNVLSACYSVYAGNLLFLNRDLDKAEKYIDKSIDLSPLINLSLAKAYIYLLKGNESEADMWLNKFYTNTKNKKVKIGFHSFVIKLKKLEDIIDNFLLGQIYYMKRDIDKAKSHFISASQNNFDIYYTKKAKEMLNTINQEP